MPYISQWIREQPADEALFDIIKIPFINNTAKYIILSICKDITYVCPCLHIWFIVEYSPYYIEVKSTNFFERENVQIPSVPNQN